MSTYLTESGNYSFEAYSRSRARQSEGLDRSPLTKYFSSNSMSSSSGRYSESRLYRIAKGPSYGYDDSASGRPSVKVPTIDIAA